MLNFLVYAPCNSGSINHYFRLNYFPQLKRRIVQLFIPICRSRHFYLEEGDSRLLRKFS